ncbi:hypothetical protein HQQ80_01455 [Microbacteriaceae bacterium VKM Ac-2855]|nr:hypothetical protein [Microbacteriaceae bacterium VKM Ac-2855]
MSWWTWVLIWAVLVLALLSMLAMFAWQLFRKGMHVLRQTEELTAKMARLGEFTDSPPTERPLPALLVPYEEVVRHRENRRELREEHIQARRAARVQRGKLLVHRNPIVK